MFLFVHNVDLDGRPTLAARGSHRTFAYYSYTDSWRLSRFSDAFVESHYEVAALTGKAGGGFLLDTNALHKAQLVGSRSRTAIQLEWHAHRKVPSLATHPAASHLPCPTFKGAATRAHGTAGQRSYELYTPD